MSKITAKHKKLIVWRLNKWRAYGNAYKNIHRLKQAFPPHERNATVITDTINALRKDGVVFLHKKNTCISLNPRATKRIRKLIAE